MEDDAFDDATLWAVIDSAAACYTTSTTAKLLKPPAQTLRLNSPSQLDNNQSPSYYKLSNHYNHPHKKPNYNDSNSPVNLQLVKRSPLNSSPKFNVSSPIAYDESYPQKKLKYNESITSNITPINLRMVKRSTFNSSPIVNVSSPICCDYDDDDNDKENSKFRHCLAGQFPSVSLFKDFQDAAMAILEKSDYIVISGNPFIKKSGWRKIAFYFNVSFEIRDKTIEFDENRNVQRAEFVARAYMQGGRFADGWGSCERREKKFLKPNNDIPSTAETRAKNRACQDLLGIGQYRPGVCQNSHTHSSR